MRVLIFTASYGGGHNANSKVVKEILESKGYQTKIVDITSYSQKLGGRTLGQWFYHIISMKVRILLPITFGLSSILPKRFIIWGFGMQKVLSTEVNNYKPDLIISVYGPVNAILDYCSIDQNIKRITIVTDTWGKIFYWFYGVKDQILLMDEAIKEYALSFGIEESRIKVIMPLVESKYLKTLTFEEVKKAKEDLNLDQDKKIILILGGGEGLPNLNKITHQLSTNLENINIIAVCGKDRASYDNLMRLKEKHIFENLAVFGFVNNVYELINISDIVISKAGPMSILEVLSLKKPLIITTYYPQEKGNLDYLIKNNFGIYQPDPTKLSKVCKLIFNGEVKFDKYEQKGARLERLI
jgi:UDP-N-acetylglucosamine:LPS N-acetylglucosamine transferase